MTVVETVLVFVVLPLGIVAVIGLLTVAPSAMRGQIRYRPGRPWTYDTAWWLPESETSAPAAPAALGGPGGNHRPALEAGATAPAALPAGPVTAAAGGASGEW